MHTASSVKLKNERDWTFIGWTLVFVAVVVDVLLAL
jgi:hypothetical protein